MTLASQLATDRASFYNEEEFAVPGGVTYNGGPTTIPAIVTYDDNLDESTGSAVATATMQVQAADVANPAYRDPVIIDSVTWYVRKIIWGGGVDWALELYRDERPVI